MFLSFKRILLFSSSLIFLVNGHYDRLFKHRRRNKLQKRNHYRINVLTSDHGTNVGYLSLQRNDPNVCIYQEKITKTYEKPCVKSKKVMQKVWKTNCLDGKKWCLKNEPKTVYYKAIKIVEKEQLVDKYRCCDGWEQEPNKIGCTKYKCHSDTCLNGGSCLNNATTICQCRPQFRGKRCEIDVDECLEKNHNCDQECVNTYGSFTCLCHDGYQLNKNGRSCDDIDECARGEDKCEHYCLNARGSYRCECRESFQLDANGYQCHRMNESPCLLNNGGCSHKCAMEDTNPNEDWKILCSCPLGMMLNDDQKTCRKADRTCSFNNGECQQLCREKLNKRSKSRSVECYCRSGYETDTHNSSNCIDINECDKKVCEHHCKNTIGSYSCSCDNGFRIDEENKHRCIDINECEEMNVCDGYCINRIGSFECLCRPGFEYSSRKKKCLPITLAWKKNEKSHGKRSHSPNFSLRKNSTEKECDDHHYGNMCQYECNCLNDGICDKVTGRCICPPGIYGEMCEDGCQKGFFGNKCEKKCNCPSGVRCDRLFGFCQCNLGTWGLQCDKACPKGYFGSNCLYACTCNKRNSLGCDSRNGRCLCKSGFTGLTCSSQCKAGRWGTHCRNKCPFQCRISCNRLNGRCQQLRRQRMLSTKMRSKKKLVCSFGHYGLNCRRRCNCGAYDCNSVSGECKCPAGLYGIRCEKQCPLGKWGENCKKRCDCNNRSRSCNRISGNCVACSRGWRGSRCDLPCKEGTYGRGCLSKCRCKFGAKCDTTNGKCYCMSGFTGKYCEKICPIGTWGVNCKETCDCSDIGTLKTVGMNASMCDAITSACKCGSGYWGKRCEKKCMKTYWGHNCMNKCDCNKNGTAKDFNGNFISCRIENGQCNCASGFYGKRCEKKCPQFTYGIDCVKRCKCAINNTIECNRNNGKCECRPGYFGSNCEKRCPNGLYGKDCDKKCGCSLNGTNSKVCDSISGKCECKNGFYGSDCSLNCQFGYFGKNCEQKCNCGKHMKSCNPVHGCCVCAPGYYGPKCQFGASLMISKFNRFRLTFLYVAELFRCPTGWYGDYCQKQCQCSLNHTRKCDAGTGICVCADGYVGMHCEKKCVEGKWGKDCQKDCSSHCRIYYEKALEEKIGVNYSPYTWSKRMSKLNELSLEMKEFRCHHISGKCECPKGYKGEKCDKKCSHDEYGHDCRHQCKCGVRRICDRFDGKCSCPIGYTGRYCQLLINSQIGRYRGRGDVPFR
ncbi:hypothetical protein SNEBB_011152 [Seison nebaliae]|nr:hypothetical protein SNEBB_011152 [Seison nebaliae]